jgi:flagellar basal body-associated protein FliL
MQKDREMKKKSIIIISIIIVILIGVRVALPYLVVNYVNKVLADIPGYQGSIKDVDLDLYRGAYVIDSLDIQKINGKRENLT